MSHPFDPIRLVVLQPTPYCNLDCDYCYLPDRDNRSRLPVELVESTLRRVMESPFLAGDFTVLWHAGEPLTVPIDFYDEERWCDCFTSNRMAVGVSLDGPAFLHDAHRRTRTGLGTHASTMRGIAHLQRNDIPFHVIAVLTEDSLAYADELFSFFLEHGISDLGFNMEETEGANQRSSLDRPGAEHRYRTFLERFWELSERRRGALRLREFEITCAQAYSNARLDHQAGNFYTFDPELLAVATEEYGDFILGNVSSDSLESICHTDKFRRIHRDLDAGIELCRGSCDYFAICGGGAGSNKYWEKGTFSCSETQACRYRIQMVANVVLAGLERSLGLEA